MKKMLTFTARWCSMCNKFHEKLKQVKTDVVIENVDYDDETKKCGKHKIKMLPTMIMFENDIEIKRVVPTNYTLEQLSEWINT